MICLQKWWLKRKYSGVAVHKYVLKLKMFFFALSGVFSSVLYISLDIFATGLFSLTSGENSALRNNKDFFMARFSFLFLSNFKMVDMLRCLVYMGKERVLFCRFM